MVEGATLVPDKGPLWFGHRRRAVVGAFVALVALVVVIGVAARQPSHPDEASGVDVSRGRSVTGIAETTRRSTGATASTTTTAPTTTTTRPPGPASMRLAFSGDLLSHLPLVRQAEAYGRDAGTRYEFRPMLDPMKPVIEPADVAICHMEVPVSPDQGYITGYPAFGAPAELVDAVKTTGYDGCSTASNHSLDRGLDGIAATLDRFDIAGLKHAGTARTAEEGATVTVYDVGGAKVAHLSYAYGFNGYVVPGDAPHAANQIDVQRIHDESTAARQAGAQLVLVSLHWGTEYRHDPDQFQQDIAAGLLPWPDIDVIVGHHAHVVQPIQQIEGTYVVWGLGNQLANQPEVPRSDGLTVVLSAEQQANGRYRVAGIEAVPTWVEPGTFRVLPIVRTLADPAVQGSLRDSLIASYDRTVGVLNSRTTSGVVVAPKP